METFVFTLNLGNDGLCPSNEFIFQNIDMKFPHNLRQLPLGVICVWIVGECWHVCVVFALRLRTFTCRLFCFVREWVYVVHACMSAHPF